MKPFTKSFMRICDVYNEEKELVAYNLEISQPEKPEWTTVLHCPIASMEDELIVSVKLVEQLREFAYMGYILKQGKERS